VSLIRRVVFGQNPRRTAVRVLVLAAISFVTFGWIFIPIRAEGISMLPTYQSGTLHLVNRLAFTSTTPARGDVVAIRLAGPHVLYVKRVIGLPGERIAILQGRVQINGAHLVEPYVEKRRPWDVDEVTLSQHEYYVIGDNRGMSVGDHDFGRVDRSKIVGKVVF
jgi:signal peptidase I